LLEVGRKERVDFSSENLRFRHLDIKPRNLLFTKQGELWIIDWEFAGFYPESFDQFFLYDRKSKWAMNLHNRLFDGTTKNLDAMIQASRINRRKSAA